MRPKSLAAVLLTVFLLLAGNARAQLFLPPSDAVKPALTQPLTVAMIYYRFSGQSPDFQAWALLTEDYRNAEDYDKIAMQGKKADELAQGFELLASDEAVTADFTATLSDYSLKNQGYLIENFTADMFLPFSYARENYAVVPKSALDHQWLAVSDLAAAKRIDDLRSASKNGRDVTLTLTLAPRFADKNIVNINGTDYRLVASEMKGLAIFDAAGALVWRQQPDQSQTGAGRVQKQLMDLYK